MNLKPKLVEQETYPGYIFQTAPRNVYWEMTIACDLDCVHCRASAIRQRDPLELTTDEGKALMREVKKMGSMLILTGGDPIKRDDLFELIDYGREIALPVSVTPSTTPTLTREVVERFKALGIVAMGTSLDGPNAEIHDSFRRVEGTFSNSVQALTWAREFHIPVQINTTITTDTLAHLPEMYRLLREQFSPPVKRWSLFLLVPIGRGEELGVPTAEQVEELFEWVYDVARDAPFHIGTVEAPHYRRYWIQQKLREGMDLEAITKVAMRMGFGVRDGNGVLFVSHRGDVYPAGFLPYPYLGNVHDDSLASMYRDSPHLAELRDMNRLKGKCGDCEFRWLCGGSRARAYGMTGDSMESDPFCVYDPTST